MDNIPLPSEKHPEVIGVFDPFLNFAEHCERTSAKASRTIAILKALSGTNLGQRKETLLVICKTLVRPVLDNACPAWFHAASFTSSSKLQVVQNAALRTITTCTKKSAPKHLHSEC